MPNTRVDYTIVTAIVTALVTGAALNWFTVVEMPMLGVWSVLAGVLTAAVYYYSDV